MASNHVKPLLPIFTTAGIIIGAHGLQLTFVAVRGAHEGFPATVIGVMSAVYSVGFALGCLCVSRLFFGMAQKRALTLLAVVASILTASMVLTDEPSAWIVIRFLSGFAYASLLAVIESEINANVSNSYRARALSIYRLISLGTVALAQQVIPSVEVDGPAVFFIISVAILISLVPISFIKTSGRASTMELRFNFVRAWHTSPIAVLGAIAVGLTVTTFRSTGPVYAHSIGLTPAEIANFMSAGIIGGLILQYPLGVFSDRSNRVAVILCTAIGAAATEMFLATFAGTNEVRNIAGTVIFGAFSFPIYALCAAHGNDRAEKRDYVMLASTLLFFVSIGGALGPLIVSAVMQSEGQASFFYYMMAVHGLMSAYIIYELSVKSRKT
ncbi:MFS transporter [Rhizobium sp. P44RR-XXIV]|uniref:MFS transporter n=1 Tax=Rhizobium sp. P44RR-XXIV TaxID=1921145 RepID=UPI000985E3AA|nr:MFS transporter [Rhizobium sp. P44RR-XXIV]TIX90523.1 MFS transporter [Rhizobium sp. P44RR-XXIV]